MLLESISKGSTVLPEEGIVMSTIVELIEREITSWPDVVKQPHRFGGIEFRVSGHEIGHLHGSRQADLPFSVRQREELVAAGKASLHHILPDTGWVSYYIRGPESIPGLIELFRLNYEHYHRSTPATSSGQE